MNDRVKLEAFKTTLSTKQKAIEQMRYNYIKSDQQSMLQKADLMHQAKSKFVNIQPPVNIDKKSPGPADYEGRKESSHVNL